MSIELKVPEVGESIKEVLIGDWLKSEGDHVERDEDIVVIETDKATVEIPAPDAGTIGKVLKQSGEKAAVGEVIAYLETGESQIQDGGGKKAKSKSLSGPSEERTRQDAPETATLVKESGKEDAKEAEAQRPTEQPKEEEEREKDTELKTRAVKEEGGKAELKEKAADEEERQPADLNETERSRRRTKTTGKGAEEVKVEASENSPSQEAGNEREFLGNIDSGLDEGKEPAKEAQSSADRGIAERDEGKPVENKTESLSAKHREAREEKTVPMTPIRRRIAERLVEAQHTTAFLTTFNEIDMSSIKALREEHREAFQEKHQIKLGFMSFFVKAAIEALKLIPQVNAEIRGTDLVFHNYYDIGVAVGGGKGLVVPVLRNAERMSFAGIEKAIDDFARRAETNRLKPEDLEGGTFTISNGGIYGSLLSTPILNFPQSGILGLHAIQDRPVVRNGQIVVRPMMYVALTYDHRIVDGREAVTFLKHIKDCIEAPFRMQLEV